MLKGGWTILTMVWRAVYVRSDREAMTIWRGLFRIWWVLSGLWLALVGLNIYIIKDRPPLNAPPLKELPADLWPMFWDSSVPLSGKLVVFGAFPVGTLAVALILAGVVLSTLRWFIQGFVR